MAADRHTVFVVGAGFSFDLGYPLTSQLLPRVKTRFSRTFAEQFEDVVRFHHPGWDRRRATLPDIEQLLTELSANEDLLPAIRSDGPFDAATLGRFQKTCCATLLFGSMKSTGGTRHRMTGYWNAS